MQGHDMRTLQTPDAVLPARHEMRTETHREARWVEEGSGMISLCTTGGVQGGPCCLVFGMNWRPLLGSQLARQAIQRARGLRATHYAWRGEVAASVACARWRRTEMRLRPRYAAALLAAQLCGQGTFALCLDGGTRGIWLLAVHDGAVIAGTDVWYPTVDEAAQALQVLQQRYPTLREAQLGDTVEAFLAVAAEAGPAVWAVARLQRVPAAVRWPWWAAMTGVLVVGWQAGVAPLMESPVHKDNAGLDRERAWLGVYDDYAAVRRVHDSAALRGLLQGVAVLPLRRQGWGLEQAECRANMAGWRCAARYRRAVRVADNNDLSHRWPADWQVEYEGFDQARTTWQIAGGKLLDWRRLPSQHALLRGPVALLQRQAPVFEQISLGQAQTVALSEPIGTDGLPLPALPHLPVLLERRLSLTGALRGLPLLQDIHWPVSWEQLTIEIKPPAAATAERESRLVAHLQGVIYGKN